MFEPIRLRLSRQKGFDLQTHSREQNGLPAVNVARPFRWGNSWRIGSNLYDPKHTGQDGHLGAFRVCETVEDCVQGFRQSVDWNPDLPWRVGDLICTGGYGPEHRNRKTIRAELSGKNLACWCALDAPCHADVLLEIANVMECEPAT